MQTALATAPVSKTLEKLIEEAVTKALASALQSATLPTMQIELPEPTARLTRPQTAAALTRTGYPTSTATLTTMATRGGGPPFAHWGPRVRYTWADALAWAEGRVSGKRRSTSETSNHQAI